MLETMRQLALTRLWLDLDQGIAPDPETWYRSLRERDLGRLLPYLVEDVDDETEDRQHYYALSPHPTDEHVAVLDVCDLQPGDAAKLPFVAQTGNATPIGPIIKRSVKVKTTTIVSPQPSTQTRMLEQFAVRAKSTARWSSYFQQAHNCWTRRKLFYEGQVWKARQGSLQMAVDVLQEKHTILLAFRTREGKLPGEVPAYRAYLEHVLADRKYITKETPGIPGKRCSLCGAGPVMVYPNALYGAGINLANMDRLGAFSGLDLQTAWKCYALCLGCADLLFVYWNHIGKKDFVTNIAGERALILPLLTLTPTGNETFQQETMNSVVGNNDETVNEESTTLPDDKLLQIANDPSVLTLKIVWATFGQRLEDVRGVITGVRPSRLRALAKIQAELNRGTSTVFPDPSISDLKYDVSLTMLQGLLWRPGGNKVQKKNDSRRLFDLRRDLAEAIYRQTPMPWQRFWVEIHETARCYVDEAAASNRHIYGLLYEEPSKRTGVNCLTAAGWVRHLARFLHFCRKVGATPMSDVAQLYRPNCDFLQVYMGPETAIDSPAKAFAFILGALYGKLLQIQIMRGVNIVANALTWLKRFNLAGKDLPELYIKIREKLMMYGTEKNPTVRDLVIELGGLGARLGTDIKLDETQACYYLLLGQSLATKMTSSRDADKDAVMLNHTAHVETEFSKTPENALNLLP